MNNPNNSIQLLKRDKHELLEGMCSEHIFSDDVLTYLGLSSSASFGWWVSLVNKQYVFFKVSSDISLLTQSDLYIFKYLNSRKLDSYLVTTLGDLLFFLRLDNNGDMVEFFDLAEFLSKIGKTRALNNPLQATNETRISTKQSQAIVYMKKNGILEEVALNRYFANYILSVYFGYCVWNIDVFIASQNTIKAFEIKYKYPTMNNKYGINIGASNLFRWLINEIGIEVHHFILKNPTHNENMSVLDLIKDYTGKAKWISCKLENSHFEDAYHIAPSKTQISGSREQKVKYIDANEFSFVKFLY